MPGMINDLAVKWDIRDVPDDFRDLCRPFLLVISVVDTEFWHGDAHLEVYILKK